MAETQWPRWAQDLSEKYYSGAYVQFVLHEMLKVESRLRKLPQHADIDTAIIDTVLEEGGFAFLPAGLPHAFLNLTDDPGEVLIVYVPGGGHHFYAELEDCLAIHVRRVLFARQKLRCHGVTAAPGGKVDRMINWRICRLKGERW